ncbi:hypothetical protein Tco_1276192 [Tanacetum coccineum]
MESEKYLEGQSMQRPPLFESDGFIYWKNRFETYVKSKDLDLWHVITDGDFPPIQFNPETKKDEIVSFHKQNDDLKKKLAKNNEAKMVIYNALPRKEYERIFMCQTAKEIWDTLLITHQGNNQVKANKIDLLVQQYEQFMIPEDESIDNAFAKFNTIITSLKALDEGFIARIVYESNKKVSETVKAKEIKVDLLPKTRKESSDEDSSTSDSRRKDEEYVMAVKKTSRNYFKKTRRFVDNHMKKENHLKEIKMTKIGKAKENALSAEIQIISSENVTKCQESLPPIYPLLNPTSQKYPKSPASLLPLPNSTNPLKIDTGTGDFYSQVTVQTDEYGYLVISFMIQHEFITLTLAQFGQILKIPYNGQAVFTNEWDLASLEYSQETEGPYSTDLPTPNDIRRLLELERVMQWEELIRENVFGLGGHRDHLPACLAHMLYCVVAKEQYNLAYFFVKRIKCARANPTANLPYGMFFTRLYRHIMEAYPHLDNGIYDIVDRVMRPLALKQTRQTRSDYGKARHSVSSSSSHYQGTSSHQHDDDDDDDFETSRASTPSPTTYLNYLDPLNYQNYQMPSSSEQTDETLFERQTDLLNQTQQMHKEMRGGFKSFRKALKGVFSKKKK